MVELKESEEKQLPAEHPSTTQLSTNRVDTKLEHLHRLSRLLDSQFNLPVVGRVGIDPIIGLIPWVGDYTSYALSIYIIVQAGRLGVPPRKLGLMSLHALLDALLGLMPVIGDFIDMKYRANKRNVSIVLDHFDVNKTEDGNLTPVSVTSVVVLSRKAKIILWSILIVLTLGLISIFALVSYLVYYIIFQLILG